MTKNQILGFIQSKFNEIDKKFDEVNSRPLSEDLGTALQNATERGRFVGQLALLNDLYLKVSSEWKD